MRCVCGHPRRWHRSLEAVRRIQCCHARDCGCTRYAPDADDGEPVALPWGRGRGMGAAA